MITLTPPIIALIRADKKLKKALIEEFGYSERILYLDLKNNSPRLTQYGALLIIAQFAKQPLTELVTL